MKLDVAIGEEDERGRRDRGLGHVEDANALGHRHRRALEVDLVQEAVHLAGGDALTPLLGDVFDLLHELLEVGARSRGDENHRGVAQVFERVAYLLLIDGPVGRGLAVGARGGEQVPLVDDDDHRAAALVRIAADVGVVGGHAFGSVDHEQGDVAGFEMTAGHDDGEFFGHQMGLALAADAGGVDEAQALAFVLDDFVDGVARGACNGRNDGPRSSGKRIEQRRFADVGTADDRDRSLMLFKFAMGAMEWAVIGRWRIYQRSLGVFRALQIFFVAEFAEIGDFV